MQLLKWLFNLQGHFLRPLTISGTALTHTNSGVKSLTSRQCHSRGQQSEGSLTTTRQGPSRAQNNFKNRTWSEIWTDFTHFYKWILDRFWGLKLSVLTAQLEAVQIRELAASSLQEVAHGNYFLAVNASVYFFILAKLQHHSNFVL